MTISQTDRIIITKKMVSVPLDNASADRTKAQIDAAAATSQTKDTANKNLMDSFTPLINGYQSEVSYYDGNQRTQLVEQDIQDSSNRVKDCPFFPNDPTTPLPSLPSGVWTYMGAFALNKAIGKTYTEGWAASIANETALVISINAQIAQIQALSGMNRSTGQVAISGTPAHCSLPAFTNQPDCLTGGGTWIPDTPDQIVIDPIMQGYGTNLKNLVDSWRTVLTNANNSVPMFDTDPTRYASNVSTQSDIINALSIINTWWNRADFDTNHGQTTVSGFNNYDYNTLQPTKFRQTELQLLINEINARSSTSGARITTISDYLGNIVQSLTDGTITSSTGLYGKRYGFIDIRLNSITGSLSELKGFQMGSTAQDQFKAGNTSALNAYSAVIVCTPLRAPALGTSTIQVVNGALFSISDSVYLVADGCDEISATILSISGNTVSLSTNVSQKYTTDNSSRIYKLL